MIEPIFFRAKVINKLTQRLIDAFHNDELDIEEHFHKYLEETNQDKFVFPFMKYRLMISEEENDTSKTILKNIDSMLSETDTYEITDNVVYKDGVAQTISVIDEDGHIDKEYTLSDFSRTSCLIEISMDKDLRLHWDVVRNDVLMSLFLQNKEQLSTLASFTITPNENVCIRHHLLRFVDFFAESMAVQIMDKYEEDKSKEIASEIIHDAYKIYL